MPNHPWAGPILSSLCGKLPRAAISGTSPFQQVTPALAPSSHGCRSQPWVLAAAWQTGTSQAAPELRVSDGHGHWTSVGCGASHQDLSVLWVRARRCWGGDGEGRAPATVPWRVNLRFTPQQHPLCCSTWDQQLLSSDLRQLCLKSVGSPLT